MKAKTGKAWLAPLCTLGGLAVICLGVYGLMQYFGSPLVPGSLERRYAREISEHREELESFSQKCLETGSLPEDQSLPGFIRDAQVVGQANLDPEDLFVEFFCDGWGLVSASSYYGFYYSLQGPQAYQGVEVELTPENGGYAWHEAGDNHGFTREIGDGFYYFEAHF